MRHNFARSMLAMISFALLLASLALTSTATATTTWYVNGVSGSDSNNCTFATTACKTIGHAISLAASGDAIKVAAATYTENLTIGISLRILGAGAKTTIIDGGGVGRVVIISSTSANVTLSELTITHGDAVGFNAGISNVGTLRIIRSTVSGNKVHNSCAKTSHICVSSGGGIGNGGALTIINSTVANNSAFSFCYYPCPPIEYGGGIYNGGTLSLSNTTVTGNVARGGGWPVPIPGLGGGIYNVSTVSISSSTVSTNSGGDISNTGNATLQNSIVANGFLRANCSGTIISNGHNLSSDASCNFTNAGDLNNTDPLLGPLQYNGGPTQTMALPSGSPAVDAGNPSGCTDSLGHLLKTDQRGAPRPDTEDTGGCDIGAYERQSD